MKFVPYIVSGVALLVLIVAGVFMYKIPREVSTQVQGEHAQKGSLIEVASTSVKMSEEIPQSWKTYRNERIGFAVSYPPEWKILSDNEGDVSYLMIASTSTLSNGTMLPTVGPWIEVKKPLTAYGERNWNGCSDDDGAENDFSPTEGNAYFLKMICVNGISLNLSLDRDEIQNEDLIRTLNTIAGSFSTFKGNYERVYRVGDKIYVTGTVGEILADDLWEIRAQTGTAPDPVIKIGLDKQYVQMGEGDIKEEIYGIRMNYGSCVPKGLKSGDKVSVEGSIKAIPMEIGLVLSCEDGVWVQKF